MIVGVGNHLRRFTKELTYMGSASNAKLKPETVTHYTVFHRYTHEAVGDDFTLDGARYWAARLNEEDDADFWSYFETEKFQMLDSLLSLVQDHENRG